MSQPTRKSSPGWLVKRGRRGAQSRSREQKGRIESDRLIPNQGRPSIGGQEGAGRAAGCENIDGLERTGNRGTDTTETKRKRRHLAGSGEVPRLRSAVAMVETAVALVGPGCKRRRRCKTPSCSCAARRCSISPLIHPASPPAGAFSSLLPHCVASAGGSGSLLIVHPGGLDYTLEAGEMDSQPGLPNQ